MSDPWCADIGRKALTAIRCIKVFDRYQDMKQVNSSMKCVVSHITSCNDIHYMFSPLMHAHLVNGNMIVHHLSNVFRQTLRTFIY